MHRTKPARGLLRKFDPRNRGLFQDTAQNGLQVELIVGLLIPRYFTEFDETAGHILLAMGEGGSAMVIVRKC
jgi:hypothetical protein